MLHEWILKINEIALCYMNHLCKTLRTSKLKEAESKALSAKGWGKEGTGSDCPKHRAGVWMMTCSLHNFVHRLKTTEWYTYSELYSEWVRSQSKSISPQTNRKEQQQPQQNQQCQYLLELQYSAGRAGQSRTASSRPPRAVGKSYANSI